MLISIQFLRAFASLIVLLHHIGYKDKIYGNNILEFFHFGDIGVDIFFIISGYIMMYSTHNKPISAQKFMKNRLIRILPLYWLLTSIALVIFFIFPEKVNSSGGNTVIIASYFLLPTEGNYLIQNGWTLSYEFLFYFIFMISLLVLSIVCLYYFKVYEQIIEIRAIYYGIPALLFSASFLFLEKKLHKFKNLILILGNSSYSLYLTHPFILVANAMVVKRIYSENLYFDIILITSMLFSSIIIGILTYKYIEIKQIDFLRKKK